MKKILVNAGLVIVSVALCFGVAELGIRLAYPRLANYNLEMWRYSAELKQRLDQERLPFFHFPNREGDFYGVSIKTNSVGFRDDERTPEKPAGKKRIAVLGDSMTLGWGVRFEDTVPKSLERLLNQDGDRYEVLNMSVGNYNTTMEADLFEWKGLAFHPDVVVLLYFINDVEPIPRLSRLGHAIKKRSYLQAFLFDRYVALRPCWDKSFRWSDYYTSLYAPGAPGLAANRDAVAHLAALCRAKGISLLIASYPELHELKDYPFPQATEHIRQLAGKHQVPFVDLLPYLAPHEPSTLWVSPEDTHGNALACQLAAQGIYEFLARMKPFDSVSPEGKNMNRN